MQRPQTNAEITVDQSTLNEVEAMTPHVLWAIMDGLLSPGEAARLLADEIQSGLIVEASNG